MAAPKNNLYALGNNGGRPTTYKSKYCEMVIELGRQGKSQIQIASALNVPRSTMLSWAKKHEEFSTALTYAKECEQAWWEDVGQNALYTSKFQTRVWIKSMQARFRNDYTQLRDSISCDKSLPPEPVDKRKQASAVLQFIAKASTETEEQKALESIKKLEADR
jgi:hypothetical protein